MGLPLSPGRAEKHGFEYYRRGTLSLYAALDVKTGQVHGKTARRHTSEEFLAFLPDIVERTPDTKEIHIIIDNLSAHKTTTVTEFLDQNPRVRFHFAGLTKFVPESNEVSATPPGRIAQIACGGGKVNQLN